MDERKVGDRDNDPVATPNQVQGVLHQTNKSEDISLQVT